MKYLSFIIISIFLTLSMFAQPNIGLQSYATGFMEPVKVVHANDNRLYVVERDGRVWIIDELGNTLPNAFLDIDDISTSGGSEQGLLGIAFHPDYPNTPYFYSNYTNNSGDTHISRFEVNPANPDTAMKSSEQILLVVAQHSSNHNAGDLAFGPDGYLYIPLGDGGGSGDAGNYAQNLLDPLGKTLRIDIDTAVGYKIPPTNPFVGNANVLDEIWHIGLRNPWRFSFDRLTGDMWIGDVGQFLWEEVDFQPANSLGGENFGWRCYEGNNTFNTAGCGPIGNYTFPVFDYASDGSSGVGGCSVAGGYVYRGCDYPDLYGYYVFADYCSGRIWTIHDSSGNWIVNEAANVGNWNLSGFGESTDGEMFVTGLSDGVIYKVTTQGVKLNLSATSTDESCQPGNDGSINLTISGGKQPYIHPVGRRTYLRR